MHIQIAFRKTDELKDDLIIFLTTGLIEYFCPEKDAPVPDGMIGRFRMDFGKDGNLITPATIHALNEYRLPMDGQRMLTDPGIGVTEMVTQRAWNRPSSPGECEFFMRRTLVKPAMVNRTVLCFAGIAALPAKADICQDSIFQLSGNGVDFSLAGRLGKEVRPGWKIPPMKFSTAGEQMSAFLRTPAWGFGLEPVQVPWDRSLSFAAKMDRYTELSLADDLPDYQAAELEDCRRVLSMHGMDSLHRSPEYRLYMKALKSSGGLPFCRAEPQTVSDLERRGKIARRVSREVMKTPEEESSMRP